MPSKSLMISPKYILLNRGKNGCDKKEIIAEELGNTVKKTMFWFMLLPVNYLAKMVNGPIKKSAFRLK